MMGQAPLAAKDQQPGAGPSGLSGPHHHLQPMLAEIPPVTRSHVKQMRQQIEAEPVSMLFGLVIGMIIGFYIRDSINHR